MGYFQRPNTAELAAPCRPIYVFLSFFSTAVMVVNSSFHLKPVFHLESGWARIVAKCFISHSSVSILLPSNHAVCLLNWNCCTLPVHNNPDCSISLFLLEVGLQPTFHERSQSFNFAEWLNYHLISSGLWCSSMDVYMSIGLELWAKCTSTNMHWDHRVLSEDVRLLLSYLEMHKFMHTVIS